MSNRRYGAFLCLTLCSTLARAQVATVANTPTARSHFDEGLAQAAQGDLPAALREFEAAYELQPNYSVLYNIGQARAALGRPVEAIAAFDRYLAEGGQKLSTSRRAEVTSLLAAAHKRVGQIRLGAEVAADTHIWADGAEVAIEQLRTGLPLSAGTHSILHATPTCLPVSQQVTVTAGETLPLELAPSPNCQQPQGLLEIDCSVPGVDATVVGVKELKTPVAAPLLVPLGNVTVRFNRPGYRNTSPSVLVGPTALSRVQCSQLALSPVPASLAARLIIRKAPANANVVVDGQPFESSSLPAGPHDVLVEHAGYVSTSRHVSLEAGKSTTIEAMLTPTTETAKLALSSRSHRKLLGVGLGSAALGLWGTAGGLYAWNSARYADWRSARQQTGGDVNTVAAVQRIDDLSIALTIIGAGLAIGGTWLFFEGE